MLSERQEYLRENSSSGNKCNGFRPGHSYGHGRTLTFRIPRDCYGNFHPRILASLRHLEDECERLAGGVNTKGLMQKQSGKVFQDIYGEHYSKASISRLLDYLREDVSQWFTRSLGGEMLAELQGRGVRKIGLVCADGLKGLEDAISAVFPGTPLQRCTTHLKRNLPGCVRNGNKGELAENLRLVFRTGDRSYTVERAWEQWQTLCEKWGQDYRSFRRRAEDSAYKANFTYLNYEARIQSMLYTPNWNERLQKDFRRVTRMRGTMPNEESVLLLMGKKAMDKKSYLGRCREST